MRTQELLERWIEPDSVKSGPEEARVKGYGVHVWALVNLLKTYHLEKQAAARAYDLPLEAIDAVLAHYRAYKRVLDAKIALVASDDPVPCTTDTNGDVSAG
jgi:uncharacterized protein (DUF433 family)